MFTVISLFSLVLLGYFLLLNVISCSYIADRSSHLKQKLFSLKLSFCISYSRNQAFKTLIICNINMKQLNSSLMIITDHIE